MAVFDEQSVFNVSHMFVLLDSFVGRQGHFFQGACVHVCRENTQYLEYQKMPDQN